MKSYEESSGPGQSHLAPPTTHSKSQDVLESLKTQRTVKTAAWLADLFKDHLVTNQQHADSWLPQRNALIEESSREWLTALFAEFAEHVRTFNQSALGTNLQVAIDLPRATFKLADRRDPSVHRYEFTCYQGYIATPSWTLLARTFFETLQVFIVPQEATLPLQVNCLHPIESFFELRAAVNDEDVTWALSGMVVATDMIPAISRELFGDLIRVSQGAMHESELFQYSMHPLVLGENVAIGIGVIMLSDNTDTASINT